jgi:hypothetical protein
MASTPKPPPWRFSTIQNIVNVKFLGGLAVIFGKRDQDAPEQEKQDK